MLAHVRIGAIGEALRHLRRLFGGRRESRLGVVQSLGDALSHSVGGFAAVFGFLANDSRGVHAYGTNTKEQQIDLGTLRRGEVIEVSFAFDCWLGLDQFSVSLAVHSRDGVSYDWLDGVFFFRVTSAALVEGVANLNASAMARVLGVRTTQAKTETIKAAG